MWKCCSVIPLLWFLCFLLLYAVSPLISAFTFLHLCLIFITVLSMSSSCNRRKFRRPPALLKCWNSWALDSEKLCKSSAVCFTDGSPAGSLARPSTLFIDLHRRPSGTRAASREAHKFSSFLTCLLLSLSKLLKIVYWHATEVLAEVSCCVYAHPPSLLPS